VRRMAEAINQAVQDDYNAKMADTYGGKTPQETLQLYIAAVEKGDYELASKYFVIEGQKGELESLESSPSENIKNVLVLLKQDLASQGGYSNTGNSYGIRDPLYVGFQLYPNGTWKIEEI